MSRKEESLNIYNNYVKKALEESKEAIIVSGLDFNTFDNSFKLVFNNLADSFEKLSTVLSNQVAVKYDDLSIAIKNAFNKEFASQMNEILSKLK